MPSRDEQPQGSPYYLQGELESPFHKEELFTRESATDWEPHLAALEGESPFARAFEESRRTVVEPELYEEETGEESEQPVEEFGEPEETLEQLYAEQEPLALEEEVTLPEPEEEDVSVNEGETSKSPLGGAEPFAESGDGAGEADDFQSQLLDQLFDLDFNEAFQDGTSQTASDPRLALSGEKSFGPGRGDFEMISTLASSEEAEPPEPTGAVEHFSGPEHRDIGDLASGRESTTIVYGERGQRLSFGEIVALAGDYFGTYDEMLALTRTPAGRASIAWARWQALNLPKIHEPNVPDKVKDAVRERYFVLASRNLSHFSGGGSAWEAYVSWHSKAIADALHAGQQADESVWRRALTKEAFGHHFLTDMFSAGHVRMPRASIREWYERHIPNSTDRFLRYMAKFMYDRLDERQQLPTLAWFISFISSIIESKIQERIAKLGGEAVTTFSLGDIVSLALHDFDNRGLRVASDVDPYGKRIQGGYRWTAVGDSHLGTSAAGSTTKKMAVAAIIISLRDLERVRGVGRKLAGRPLSSSQRTEAVKQALGAPAFAARAFVPKEDRTAGANVPLPGANSGPSPLEWRWGQLGDIAYQEVDVAVKRRIADELFARLRDVKDPVESPIRIHGTRHAFRLFVDHLRAEGIRALEMAVGQKAR